jgi:hypothetical protein
MSLLRKFLQQPYNFYYEGKKLWQIVLVIYVLAQIYNSVVQPFEVYLPEQKFHPFIIEFIHSVIPVGVILYMALVLRLNPGITENWTLRKEVMFFVLILLQTGSIDFLIRDLIYDNPDNWSWHYLSEEIFNTLLGGLLLITPVISINLNIQLLKNQEHADQINELLSDKKLTETNHIIPVKTPLLSESFDLNLSQLIYVRAEGNYLNFYFLHTPPLMKRMTLNALENLLKEESQILRTHRSYLLNLRFVEKVSGNAQGYKVKLTGTEATVPVSRNYLEVFAQKMNAG